VLNLKAILHTHISELEKLVLDFYLVRFISSCPVYLSWLTTVHLLSVGLEGSIFKKMITALTIKKVWAELLWPNKSQLDQIQKSRPYGLSLQAHNNYIKMSLLLELIYHYMN
jgi:hypothetical protein